MGGAEFRLPLLVTIFRYTLRRAGSLNLAISFLAVVVAAVPRWPPAKQAPLASVALVAGCRSESCSFQSGSSSSSSRSPHGPRPVCRSGRIAEGMVAAFAGVAIGAVSTTLGVAGGELIIPTLVLLFGVPVKAAGTASLLISIPTS